MGNGSVNSSLCVGASRTPPPTDFGLQSTKKVQPCKWAAPFLMPIFSALARQTDVKFHGASYGLDADTLVVAVRGAALLSGQVGY